MADRAAMIACKYPSADGRCFDPSCTVNHNEWTKPVATITQAQFEKAVAADIACSGSASESLLKAFEAAGIQIEQGEKGG
jgi:hypothetical protein